MTYFVKQGNDISTTFCALIGILIGDPASPILWTLFMSDLRLVQSESDVLLNDVNVSHLKEADDILLMSYLLAGLQKLLMLVNAQKSAVIIFGPLPRALPVITLGGSPIQLVDKLTYVGITFQSIHHNIFAVHYKNKASKGCIIAHAVFGVESLTGTQPPCGGRKLYMTRVDPHLTSRCEIALGVDDHLLKDLCDVQHSVLQHLLRINKCAIIAPLFTETAVMSLRSSYRRSELALHFVSYLLSLPQTHLACAAWLMDLQLVLASLPTPVMSPNLCDIDNTMVEGLVSNLSASVRGWLRGELNSPKLYLLRDRKEPSKDGALTHKTIHFWHYLQVPVADHRKALMRLLLSDHCLVVEQQRRGHTHVPRERRVCRFCNIYAETPEHAVSLRTTQIFTSSNHHSGKPQINCLP
jgi:hypothetical protein